VSAEGWPVHSFETLLAQLATLCRHRSRLKSDPNAVAFEHLTQPTPLQQRAFQLLREALPVASA
jgi:hypothetical protein